MINGITFSLLQFLLRLRLHDNRRGIFACTLNLLLDEEIQEISLEEQDNKYC